MSSTTETLVDAPSEPLPSEKPLSSSIAAIPPPKLPQSDTLTTVVKSSDAFLQQLNRCIQTRSGADTVLLFLCYTSRLAGASLESIGRAATQRSARDLVSLALKLPPQASVKLSENPAYAPFVTFSLRLAARLKALSGLLSEVRTFGRLAGLLGLYFAARRLVVKPKDGEKAPEKPLFDKVIGLAQLVSLISFQATENVAYLASKKVLPFAPLTQLKLARWSVRSWAAYIFMELARLLVERRRTLTKGVKTAQWDGQWQKDFFRNLAWAPLTVHWSIDQGPLNDFAIGAFATWPAVGQMKDLWLANA